MNEAFEKAAEEATILKQKPNKCEFEGLYGFYKQATVGNVNIDYPGLFDFVGKLKWNAWNSKKGISQDEARDAYIQLVEELKGKYGIDESLIPIPALQDELDDPHLGSHAISRQVKPDRCSHEYCPGLSDIDGKKKWEAWDSKKGMSQDEAKYTYVELVEMLKGKYGIGASPIFSK